MKVRIYKPQGSQSKNNKLGTFMQKAANGVQVANIGSLRNEIMERGDLGDDMETIANDLANKYSIDYYDVLDEVNDLLGAEEEKPVEANVPVEEEAIPDYGAPQEFDYTNDGAAEADEAMMQEDMDQDFEEEEMRRGGSISKKKFVTGVMRSLKKAAKGMEQESSNVADITDIPNGGRGSFVNGFKQGVKNSANEFYATQIFNQSQNPQMMDSGMNQGMQAQKGKEVRNADKDFKKAYGDIAAGYFGAPGIPNYLQMINVVDPSKMPAAAAQQPKANPFEGTGIDFEYKKGPWWTGKREWSAKNVPTNMLSGMMPGMGMQGSRMVPGRITTETVTRLINRKADPTKVNTVELNNNPDNNSVAGELQKSLLEKDIKKAQESFIPDYESYPNNNMFIHEDQMWNGPQMEDIYDDSYNEMEHGGFVDSDTMDPNMLTKFINGGDESDISPMVQYQNNDLNSMNVDDPYRYDKGGENRFKGYPVVPSTAKQFLNMFNPVKNKFTWASQQGPARTTSGEIFDPETMGDEGLKEYLQDYEYEKAPWYKGGKQTLNVTNRYVGDKSNMIPEYLTWDESKETNEDDKSEDYPINTSGPRNTEMAYGGNVFNDGLSKFVGGGTNSGTGPFDPNMYDPQSNTAVNQDECSEFEKRDPNSPCYDSNAASKASPMAYMESQLNMSSPQNTAPAQSFNPPAASATGPCEEKDVLDPASPCYDAKYAEQKANPKPQDFTVGYDLNTARTLDTNAIANAGIAGGRIVQGLDRLNQNQYTENRNMGNVASSDSKESTSYLDITGGVSGQNQRHVGAPGFTGIVGQNAFAKYGGATTYEEGGTYNMSQKELLKFMAEGGQLEFI